MAARVWKNRHCSAGVITLVCRSVLRFLLSTTSGLHRDIETVVAEWVCQISGS